MAVLSTVVPRPVYTDSRPASFCTFPAGYDVAFAANTCDLDSFVCFARRRDELRQIGPSDYVSSSTRADQQGSRRSSGSDFGLFGLLPSAAARCSRRFPPASRATSRAHRLRPLSPFRLRPSKAMPPTGVHGPGSPVSARRVACAEAMLSEIGALTPCFSEQRQTPAPTRRRARTRQNNTRAATLPNRCRNRGTKRWHRSSQRTLTFPSFARVRACRASISSRGDRNSKTRGAARMTRPRRDQGCSTRAVSARRICEASKVTSSRPLPRRRTALPSLARG